MEDQAKCGLVRAPVKVSPSDVPSDVSRSGTPSADEYTLTQIRHEKHKRWGEFFEPEATDDGKGQTKFKVKQGEELTGEDTKTLEGTALPWLRSTARRFRSSMCFRTCVAREPETPLTELHLMQPVLGLLLLLAVVMLLVTTVVTVHHGLGISTVPDTAKRALAILCAALAATASAGLLYVGLIARGVPSQEELNVQLNRGNQRLGDAVEDATANASDAEHLKDMTLGRVRKLGSLRDRVRELNKQHEDETRALWAFQFKASLLLLVHLCNPISMLRSTNPCIPTVAISLVPTVSWPVT